VNQEAIDQIKAERDRLREENRAHAEFLDRKYYILAAENKVLRKAAQKGLDALGDVVSAGGYTPISFDSAIATLTAALTKEATNG